MKFKAALTLILVFASSAIGLLLYANWRFSDVVIPPPENPRPLALRELIAASTGSDDESIALMRELLDASIRWSEIPALPTRFGRFETHESSTPNFGEPEANYEITFEYCDRNWRQCVRYSMQGADPFFGLSISNSNYRASLRRLEKSDQWSIESVSKGSAGLSSKPTGFKLEDTLHLEQVFASHKFACTNATRKSDGTVRFEFTFDYFRGNGAHIQLDGALCFDPANHWVLRRAAYCKTIDDQTSNVELVQRFENQDGSPFLAFSQTSIDGLITRSYRRTFEALIQTLPEEYFTLSSSGFAEPVFDREIDPAIEVDFGDLTNVTPDQTQVVPVTIANHTPREILLVSFDL